MMFWAHSFWKFIHFLGFIIWKFYATNLVYQQHVYDFYMSLDVLVPCPRCTPHCIAYLQNTPPPKPSDNLDDAENFMRWTIVFHNAVSERIGKKVYDVEYVMHQYSHGHFDLVDVDSKLDWEPNGWTIACIVACTLLVGVLLYIVIQRFLQSSVKSSVKSSVQSSAQSDTHSPIHTPHTNHGGDAGNF